MHDQQEAEVPDRSGLLGLVLLSFIAGVASGVVAAVFRLTLEQADRLRGVLIAWAQGEALAGCALVVVGTATATALAAWLVRRFSSEAIGSGIPHIELVLMRGHQPRGRLRLILVKFFGGVLAIGSGLALGREGPSVQMGASISHLIASAFRRNPDDCRALLAAGAGAGLATAFNAPIAGAIFVLEELVRRFDTRIAIAALGASAAAIAVARVLLGHAPDFALPAQAYPGFGTVPVHLALGLLAGLVGVAYNRAILTALRLADRLPRLPVELRAALIGAGVGGLAWFAPDLVGGGDAITQRTLTGADTLGIVALTFALRFGLGAASYAAGTPGGLFAPMLVLGAQVGVLYAALCGQWLPSFTPGPTELAVVGMAALFTAVVRAPLTGIVLVTELTGSFTLMLPMLGACVAAMAVPTMLGVPPIYDSLRERLLRSAGDRGKG